jgi:hypothetical protein
MKGSRSEDIKRLRNIMISKGCTQDELKLIGRIARGGKRGHGPISVREVIKLFALSPNNNIIVIGPIVTDKEWMAKLVKGAWVYHGKAGGIPKTLREMPVLGVLQNNKPGFEPPEGSTVVITIPDSKAIVRKLYPNEAPFLFPRR